MTVQYILTHNHECKVYSFKDHDYTVYTYSNHDCVVYILFNYLFIHLYIYSSIQYFSHKGLQKTPSG